MLHASPPPLCRADAVDRYLNVRTKPQGVLISMGLYTRSACRLPQRPRVQLLVGGRPIAVRQLPMHLSSGDVPRTVIRPKQPASAFLRWQNWCGPRGPVSLRLTLGGVSIVDQFGSETTRGPECVDPSAPSTLRVSIFVRR